MDERFLEFWGNFLINTAKGKKQAEEMSKWLGKSFSPLTDISSPKAKPGFEDISEMFRKFYGLENLSEYSEEYETLAKKASVDFQKSFNDYLGMMGMVSKAEHLALIRKYEDIKKKCADQEETIRHFQMLLEAGDEEQGHAVKNLRDMAKDQAELFQKMMASFAPVSDQEPEKKETDSIKQTSEVSETSEV